MVEWKYKLNIKVPFNEYENNKIAKDILSRSFFSKYEDELEGIVDIKIFH